MCPSDAVLSALVRSGAHILDIAAVCSCVNRNYISQCGAPLSESKWSVVGTRSCDEHRDEPVCAGQAVAQNPNPNEPFQPHAPVPCGETRARARVPARSGCWHLRVRLSDTPTVKNISYVNKCAHARTETSCVSGGRGGRRVRVRFSGVALGIVIVDMRTTSTSDADSHTRSVANSVSETMQNVSMPVMSVCL